jgi:hypothetical protein
MHSPIPGGIGPERLLIWHDWFPSRFPVGTPNRAFFGAISRVIAPEIAPHVHVSGVDCHFVGELGRVTPALPGNRAPLVPHRFPRSPDSS